MITKQELTIRLEGLRNKWKGDYPKNDLDRRWWRFRADKTLALQIIEQIRKIDAGEILKAEDLTSEQVEDIFK